MKRSKKYKRDSSYFAFTPAIIHITQEALKLFEQVLQRADSQHPKVEFAEETMRQVQSKLVTMSQSVDPMSLTTFDYNERLVITAAIRLHIIDLMAAPFYIKREEELQTCQQIAAHFALDTSK